MCRLRCTAGYPRHCLRSLLPTKPVGAGLCRGWEEGADNQRINNADCGFRRTREFLSDQIDANAKRHSSGDMLCIC